jgi:hypothetical protein
MMMMMMLLLMMTMMMMMMIIIIIIIKLKLSGLEWPRVFQEVKVPRFHDNGTGLW